MSPVGRQGLRKRIKRNNTRGFKIWRVEIAQIMNEQKQECLTKHTLKHSKTF